MNQPSIRIAYAAGEFLLLAVLALVPPALVYLDVAVIEHGVGEISVTEITQESLLLITTLVFWYGAWRHPNLRGFLVLAAGFFTCALVREMDALFDRVWHGFWFWPAILVALASILFAFASCRDTVAGPISGFVGTRPYFLILIGLSVLLVFSRVFGSGNLLWEKLMGEEFSSRFKSALQESLELYGYLFICYGSIAYLAKDFDSRSAPLPPRAPRGRRKGVK